jgi:hypothetical protein
MTASDEIPRDPLEWSDEHMLQLILHRLSVEEGRLPLAAHFGVSFVGGFNESSCAVYDVDDHCIDASGAAIPGIVISMTDEALRWFRTREGLSAIERMVALMEKPIYVENWDREIV